jgi:hypothetical protein
VAAGDPGDFGRFDLAQRKSALKLLLFMPRMMFRSNQALWEDKMVDGMLLVLAFGILAATWVAEIYGAWLLDPSD